MESISKRTAKDTVFKSLFSEPKYLLQLYQALHPEDTETTEDDLTIITLQNILMNGIYNDLGFLAGDRLIILVESQSTWSPNIVVRGLMYLMSSYQEYFNSRDVNLYGTKKITLPRPEMYMVYTKERGDKPEILNLNDTFFEKCPCCIDANVKVIYLDDSDTIINQYIKFCMVLDDQVRRYDRTLTAVKNTLRICRDENLLNEYLKTRETEVEGIMLTLFDQDRVTEIWKKEYREEIRDEVWDEVRGEVRNEIRDEVRGEVRNEVRDEVREEVQEEVRKEGKFANMIENVKSLMQNMNLSAEQALQALNIAGSERQQVLAALN